jgi:hypothetical protein
LQGRKEVAGVFVCLIQKLYTYSSIIECGCGFRELFVFPQPMEDDSRYLTRSNHRRRWYQQLWYAVKHVSASEIVCSTNLSIDGGRYHVKRLIFPCKDSERTLISPPQLTLSTIAGHLPIPTNPFIAVLIAGHQGICRLTIRHDYEKTAQNKPSLSDPKATEGRMAQKGR